MTSVIVVFTQTQAPAASPATPEIPAIPSAAQIRDQVRAQLDAARAAQAQARAEGQAGSRRVTIGPNGITVQPEVPGQPTVVVNPRAMDNLIPQQAVDMTIAFFVTVAVIIIGWPIARAFGRRIERRGQVASLDAGTMEQLQRIEQAVDAMAIEVERISESQRFMARLQRDSTAQQLPGVESR